jgi:hypothetical protein
MSTTIYIVTNLFTNTNRAFYPKHSTVHQLIELYPLANDLLNIILSGFAIFSGDIFNIL